MKNKGNFSGESIHRRKRTPTSVLDESVSKLSGPYAQINKTITSMLPNKKIIFYLLLSDHSLISRSCFFILIVLAGSESTHAGESVRSLSSDESIAPVVRVDSWLVTSSHESLFKAHWRSPNYTVYL